MNNNNSYKKNKKLMLQSYIFLNIKIAKIYIHIEKNIDNIIKQIYLISQYKVSIGASNWAIVI